MYQWDYNNAMDSLAMGLVHGLQLVGERVVEGKRNSQRGIAVVNSQLLLGFLLKSSC